MSNVKRCDRCFGLYLKKDTPNRTIGTIKVYDDTDYILAEFDICPTCSNKLMKWLSLDKEELKVD